MEPEPDSEPEIIEVDIPWRGTEEWEIVTEEWEKPVVELMEAADELWGESDVVYTLQWLIRERINARESVPSLMLIPIDELMRELDSFVTTTSFLSTSYSAKWHGILTSNPRLREYSVHWSLVFTSSITTSSSKL